MEDKKVSSCEEEKDMMTKCRCMAEEKLEDVKEMAGEKIEEAKEKIKEVKAELVEKADEIKEKAEEMRKDAKDYVKKNPKKSIGIVAGIGVFLGMIVTFLFRRKK